MSREYVYRAGNAHPYSARDIPVFDRGTSTSKLPEVQAGLDQGFGGRGYASFPNRKPPGRPLPPEATGDPHPDRLARAEALRAILLAKDARHRIEGSVDREDLRQPRTGPGKGHAGKTPDIEKPRSYYVDIAAEDAALEARRGDQVLYFMTTTEAARCLTGSSEPKWAVAVKNAAGGVSKHAFGWTWTRLRSRRGKNR